MELYINTLKYFRLAIAEFTPTLKGLYSNTKDPLLKEELNDLLEIYDDIATKIDRYNLNYDDPNRFYDGEPDDIDFPIEKAMIEDLSCLSLRLLNSWKEKLTKLNNKKYLTEKNKEEKNKLEKLIWPLEAIAKSSSSVIGRCSKKGPLVFPGENTFAKENIEDNNLDIIMFPVSLLSKLPKDLSLLCNEFNFCYKNQKNNAGILLLRKILPFSIVRKFQIENKENEIKDSKGDYLETKSLLGNVEKLLSNKRIFKEISNSKILLDSSQHSYTLTVDYTDVQGVALNLRVFLDDIFNS